MAWMVVRGCAVSIALALAGGAVPAQTQNAATRTAKTSDAAAQQNTRIVSLLEQLADQARSSENTAFAVRAQSLAAKLLWTQDPSSARAIYQRAFQALATNNPSKTREAVDVLETTKTAGSIVTSVAEKRQLRTELLNEIAARDPELAEELARNIADSVEASKNGCADSGSNDCGAAGSGLTRPIGFQTTKVREDAERCELLMSAAIQVVDRDPQQAMAFAQMSVAFGLSGNLARLLTLMRAVDAERADLLFSNAVARLERSPQVDLAEVHTLGSYVVATVTSGSKDTLNKTLVLRFLNFAFDQLSGRELSAKSSRRDDSAALYFIGRQLTDLFARYLPYRLDQVQRYVNDQNEAGSYDEMIDAVAAKVRSPSDIARDAIEATDPAERDSLYARAALAWLNQGEVKEAQAAALKITDVATRDRVLVQVVRRHSSEKHLEDAVGLTRRIIDETARVELLVMLSGVARAAADDVRAAELLNEAGTCSLKARPSFERARSLVMIASSFSGFDTVRSFEVLQSAVKAINDMMKQQEDSKDELSGAGQRSKAPQSFTLDELYAGNIESTLAALAKADFDGALALARQLPGEEASVIAQLAVCGGGLVKPPRREPATTGDDTDSGLNH